MRPAAHRSAAPRASSRPPTSPSQQTTPAVDILRTSRDHSGISSDGSTYDVRRGIASESTSYTSDCPSLISDRSSSPSTQGSYEDGRPLPPHDGLPNEDSSQADELAVRDYRQDVAFVPEVTHHGLVINELLTRLRQPTHADARSRSESYAMATYLAHTEDHLQYHLSHGGTPPAAAKRTAVAG